MPDVSVMTPYIQYGFAGFAFLLLAMLFWLVRRLLGLLKDNTTVITGNTATIASAADTMTEVKTLAIEIKDQQLKNPCMLPEEIKEKIRPLIRKYHGDLSSHHIDTNDPDNPS